MVEHSYPPDFPGNLVAIPAKLAKIYDEILRRLHFYFCFRFLLIHATVPHDSSLIVSLLSVAGFSVLITVSCDEDVEEAGEDEVEELRNSSTDQGQRMVRSSPYCT